MNKLYGIVCRKFNIAINLLDEVGVDYQTVGYSKAVESHLTLNIKRRLEFPILQYNDKFYVGINQIIKLTKSLK
tara:strand:- start:169 stop:390 length:222 start_codon:yes stop_codon:yes gene_type:complete